MVCDIVRKKGGDTVTFQQIKYLLEIYRTGSIATAAKNLYLVPSSLSIAITNLEEELGCQVFTRSKRGMVPTPRGLEIIQYANKIYANYQLMTAPPTTEHRRITIAGADYESVNAAFVRTVDHYRDREDLSFSKIRLPYKTIADQIASFKLDLGILLHNESKFLSVENAMTTRGLRTTVLKRLPVVMTIGPGHRLYNQPVITHRDLENDFLIDRQDGIALHNPFYKGMLHLRKERTLFITTEFARYQLLAKGLGYRIGDPAPREITELYQLRHIPLPNLYHVLVALDNPARTLHPAAATFLEYLKEELK